VKPEAGKIPKIEDLKRMHELGAEIAITGTHISDQQYAQWEQANRP
jgi:hypothetical protein